MLTIKKNSTKSKNYCWIEAKQPWGLFPTIFYKFNPFLLYFIPMDEYMGDPKSDFEKLEELIKKTWVWN